MGFNLEMISHSVLLATYFLTYDTIQPQNVVCACFSLLQPVCLKNDASGPRFYGSIYSGRVPAHARVFWI